MDLFWEQHMAYDSVDRELLIETLKARSVKTDKSFKLASGQQDSTYIDVKKTVMRRYLTRIVGGLLCDYASLFEDYDAAAGVVLGGCHLASLVQVYSAVKDSVFRDVIFIRPEIKDHGTRNLLEMPDLSPGTRVVLFEDVVTTGNSALRAAQVLTDANLQVKGIVAVVDRRTDKPFTLGEYPFRALVNIEELL
jgi:orotate phosphoribosyltransferase